MKEPAVLAIDQGTTGSTCLVIGQDGRVLARAYSEFTQHFPKPGWVEHDALEIWDVTARVAREAIAGARDARVQAIGITNQRETIVVWDRATLAPVHRAIVWQDRRTAPICRELKEAGHEPAVRAATGLVLDPYFSGTKLTWLLRERPELRRRAEAGELACGTIDCWLIARLTGAKLVFVETAGELEPTVTGRILYPFAHLFIIQWPEKRAAFPPAVLASGPVLLSWSPSAPTSTASTSWSRPRTRRRGHWALPASRRSDIRGPFHAIWRGTASSPRAPWPLGSPPPGSSSAMAASGCSAMAA